ncbi:hypothetical protein [Microvirga subterranea]|uniref:Cytochrome-c oxidase n=1 Tax=Microvirga subterranea TaxID=186651 RepID=A0A370HR46_9HYPH|nr:hypothetical protein [Microvirga subterranea]RDI60760.1 hypothetical protein DES45_102147 [Microvirga subterranea]
MPKIDVSFILLSVLCLIVGIGMGIVMGAAHDFQFTPVHAHLNLLGWVSLALFGLIYKAYPALKTSWLAKAHLILSGSTAVIFPVGIYVSIAHENPAVAIAASFVALGGVLVFLANLVRVFFFAEKATTIADEALA